MPKFVLGLVVGLVVQFWSFSTYVGLLFLIMHCKIAHALFGGLEHNVAILNYKTKSNGMSLLGVFPIPNKVLNDYKQNPLKLHFSAHHMLPLEKKIQDQPFCAL